MKDYGLVSIITPTWACGRFICDTIRSVQAQTYTHWELLIQDDCSTDGTDKVVKPLAEMDSRIKYACNPQNSGAAITRNNALRRAKGRWIAFLDSDDLWMPEKLEKQLDFMVKNDYHFSYTNYCEMNEQSENTGVTVTGPTRITKAGMYSFCWPGCLTVMYNRDYIGLVQIADIRKNNDYAMWLKICHKADCFLLDECLAKYRRGRTDSISTHGYSTLLKWHYKLFREAENMNPISSLLLTCLNVACGLYKKKKYVGKSENDIQRMEKELFTLLRLGLDNTSVEEENYHNIKYFTGTEWQKLISLSFKQGVGAIAFDGAMKLLEINKNISLNMPELKKQRWQWSVNSFALEERNEEQIQRIKELGGIWEADGCKMLLMKGQANGLYYPNPCHRSSGDVDCYLFEDYDRGNKIAASAGAKVDTNWYKHSKIRYKGEMFENHQFFITTRSGGRSKNLNKTLCELVKENSYNTYPDSNVLLPPVMFNALFLTCHGFAHFLSEGMRLKQVLDWAMFLKAEQHNIDWKLLYQLCEEFKYSRYLHAMNDIAVHYLGVEVTNKDIIIESPYSEKIMNSILYDDDYIFSSGEGGWKDRFHLITNMFRYRWKYTLIYQESMWKQLYYYVTGYLFHTEG